MRSLVATLALLTAVPLAASASPYDGEGGIEPPARHPALVPRRPGELPATAFADRARVVRQRDGAGPGAAIARRGEGALAGKTVYLSAGHGWQFIGGAWRTQRGNTHRLVEDFITAESLNAYLIPYLQAMGAHVVTAREADPGPVAVVVDDDAARIEGNAAELDGEVGYGVPSGPLDAAAQPFAAGGARRIESAAAETGRVVYAVDVPVTGHYNVYVSYVQGADRAPDVHYVVRHGGGESHLRVDQRRHGGTWVLLGRYWFEAGAPAAVEVANDSARGGVISLDAIKIGGGMAQHDLGGGLLARPAFEVSARHHTQAAGAPPSVYDFFDGDDSDDVVARPRFAAWDHEDGEDAVYLAWHTNAPSPRRGTMSIAYGNTFPCCAGLSDFAGTAGSLELLHAVHDQLLGDLRAGWDPAWPDDGKRTASLGELRPSHNGEMPAILVEVAYHDTAADAEALRDPRFRRLAARAMARGVARYFAAADGAPLVLPPEPPTALKVENEGGALRVSFRAPVADGGDAPTGYRVYLSPNGYGFDDGVALAGTTTVLEGLAPGDLRFVRVTATNAGGESLPTEVVGARVAADDGPRVVVVGGFDRVDRFQAAAEDLGGPLGLLDRVFEERINDGSYAARHGAALAAAGYSFDGATDDAVVAGDVALDRYPAVDWFVGEDSRGDDPLPPAARGQLAAFVEGGALIVSGSELVWTLDEQGSEEDRAFARDVLGVTLAADDAESYEAVAEPGVLDVSGPLRFDADGAGSYDAEFPDVLAPAGDGSVALRYATGGAAAVLSRRGDGGVLAIGFPLELVRGEARGALMGATLRAFGIEADVVGGGGGGGDDDGGDAVGGCAAGGGGAAAWWVAFAVAAIAPRRRRAR